MKASQWFEVGGKWYYVDLVQVPLQLTLPWVDATVNGNGEWVNNLAQ